MEFYFFPFTLVVLVTCGIFVQYMINFLLMLMIKLLDWKWWIFFLRKKMPHRLGYCCLDLSCPMNESGAKFLLIGLQINMWMNCVDCSLDMFWNRSMGILAKVLSYNFGKYNNFYPFPPKIKIQEEINVYFLKLLETKE